jgi:hypothetical protein
MSFWSVVGKETSFCSDRPRTRYALGLTSQRYDTHKVEATGHTDTIRDIKMCPSILSDQELVVTVGDDKRIILWRWGNEGVEVQKVIETDKQLLRACWSFTGLFCYVTSPEAVLVFKLDSQRENLIQI